MRPIYNQTSLENFLALLKEGNPDIDITNKQITLSNPTFQVDTGLTEITVESVLDNGYSGEVNVTYTRLTLDQYITTGEFVRVESLTSMEALIETLTSTLGIVKDDITIELVSTPEVSTSDIVLLEFSMSKSVIYQDLQPIRIYVVDNDFDEAMLHRTGVNNSIRITSDGKLRKVTPAMTPLNVLIRIPNLEGFDT